MPVFRKIDGALVVDLISKTTQQSFYFYSDGNSLLGGILTQGSVYF